MAMRVLVAEDDAVSRLRLERLLPKWGYEVTVTCDGAEAWRALQAPDAPALALLDWMMPGMDGLQICRELRRKEHGSSTYVILVTARTQTEDIVEGLDAGADDYLTKPFEAAELKARLRAGRRILDLQADVAEAAKLHTIRDLAAGVAHDFNNLLTGVIGYAGFVRQALVEQGAPVHDIDRTIECAMNAARLSKQLRALAESGLQTRRTVTLRALIDDLAAACQPTLAGNVGLNADVLTPDAQVDVAWGSLQQALLSICTNAQEAMPEGGTLTIAADTARRTDQDRTAELARISIADTGRGMAPEVMSGIFDPFFSTKGTVGVGLSLALTRRVVEDHGGHIEVESVPGEGTTVCVLLPTTCSQPQAFAGPPDSDEATT